MKSLSTNISPTRFSNYFKKEFHENHRSLLLRSVIMMAILSAIAIFIGLCEVEDYNRREEALNEIPTVEYHPNDTYRDPYSQYNYRLDLNYYGEYIDDASETTLYTFITMFPFALIICSSFFFECMNSKQKKIATLMVPATYLEKFLTRFVIYIILPALIYIIGSIIAESARFIIFSVFYPSGDIINLMDYSAIIKSLKTDYVALFHTFIYYFLTSIAVSSMYVLGSSIWPKLALLKTIAAQCVISFIALISTIIAGISGSLAESMKVIINILGQIYDKLDWEYTSYLWFAYLFLIIFSLTNWTIAYFRFKESEIIQRM